MNDLSALRAPRPMPPRLETGDKKIHSILRDLEKIKNSKPSNKLKRCEHLIFNIVHSLRKAPGDHLLHSTVIWVLVTVFRIFPEETKPVMLEAGVPAILVDILKMGTLSGSSKQYASELCFYLSSNHPYPQDEKDTAPMKAFPEVQAINRYQESLDDISVRSDLSSMVNEGRGKDRYPFVPYRISDVNLAKMEALFEKGHEHQVAASLPNIAFMSNYGFSDYNPKDMEGLRDNSDSDSDDMNQDDDDVSTLSSGTRSQSEAGSLSYQLSRDTSKADLSISLARSKPSSYVRQQVKRPHTTLQKPGGLFASPDQQPKKARQFKLQQPRKEGDLLALIDDDVSIAWSQDSQTKRSGGSSQPHHVSSAPHRMIKERRHSNQSHSSPQRLNTTGGMFMSDALVSLDNFESLPKATKTARPVKTAFLSPSKEASDVNRTTDLASYLSALDPLSSNLNAFETKKMGQSMAQEVYTEEKQWQELIDSDDEDENGNGDRMDKISEDINEDENSYISNAFQQNKKLRMKAEKLIDHSFIQKFFLYKQKNIALIQDLLQRTEQLFELVDPQNTGYITFEAFTRLLIAVAPKQIVRSDIEHFVQVQTNNLQDLVDYNEFIISGKVLLLTKGQALQMQTKSRLLDGDKNRLNKLDSTHANDMKSSTKTWLTRQKQVTGDSSTYTWKAHIEWYTKRKAKAIIWLIRRATRAFDHEIKLFEAQKFLHLQAKQSIAMTFLIEMGKLALNQADKCKIARKRLIKRVVHARQFIIKVQRTYEWLRNIALVQIQEEEYLERIKSVKSMEKEADRKEQLALLSRRKQADYANLFKVKVMQERALVYLQKIAKKSRIHTDKHNKTLVYLISYAERVKGQLINKDRARKELIQRAEQAYEFCIKQDQVLLGLLRIGSTALKHFDKQVDTLQWLLQRGPEAIKFLSVQSTAKIELYQIGRRTLNFLNVREDAFIYLTQRCVKSRLFIEKKAEAIAFLRKKPYKIWNIIDNCNAAQDWLARRGQRAKDHVIKKWKSQQYLQYIAGKAASTSRRICAAFEELCQIGLEARFESFKQSIKDNKRIRKFVHQEYKRIKKADEDNQKIRKNMVPFIRNKLELREAFQILCTIYTPNHVLYNKSYMKKMEDLIADQGIHTLLSHTLGENFNLNDSYLSSLTPSKAPINLNRSTMSNLPSELSNANNIHIAYMLGRYGMRRLFNRGRLLNKDVTAIDEFFRNADLSGNGYISFQEILPWWRVTMIESPSLSYSVKDILPAFERAAVVVYKKVLKEAQEALDDDENEYLKMKRLLGSAHEGESDDEDDESELDSEEEESLMSDVNKLQNVDVGKLMRYLTRRKAVDMGEGGVGIGGQLSLEKGRAAEGGGGGGRGMGGLVSLNGDDNSSIATVEKAEKGEGVEKEGMEKAGEEKGDVAEEKEEKAEKAEGEEGGKEGKEEVEHKELGEKEEIEIKLCV